MATKDQLIEEANRRGITLSGDETKEQIEAALAGGADADQEHGDGIEQREGVEAVADGSDNLALEHTEGGVHTRMDGNDLGVPMLQGSPDEPQGPEDAFGPGPTRGDYSGRIGGVNSTVVLPGGVVVDQNALVEQGEVPGEKGGVTTDAS